MAEETNNASAATQGAIGHIVRIVGPVVDVEFAPDHMPAIYNALTRESHYPRRATSMSFSRFRCTSLATWFAPLPCRLPTAWYAVCPYRTLVHP